jgi:hypothetical protein
MLKAVVVSRFAVLSCIALLSLPANAVAGDTPIEFLQRYAATAVEAYTPTSSQYPPSKAEAKVSQEALAALRNDWLAATLPTKDMWFFKWHAGMDYTLSEPVAQGNTVDVVLKFDSLLPDEPINPPTIQSGHYKIIRQGSGWKIQSFSATPPYPFPPLTGNADLENTLNEYWKERQRATPPGRKDYLSSARPRLFWKFPRTENSPIKLEYMKGLTFFRLYRPSSWKITDVQRAGDVARVTVLFTVGHPTQLKLHKGAFSQKVEYSLLRYAKDWYIIGFRDLDEIARVREKTAAKTSLQAQLHHATKVSPPGGPAETLQAYLKGLQIFYPADGTTPRFSGAGPKLERQHWERFWSPRDQSARKASALDRNRFVIPTFRPLNWTISSVEQNGTEVNIRVTFDTPPTNALEAMIKAGQFSNTADYTLDQYKGRWVIVNYQSRQ